MKEISEAVPDKLPAWTPASQGEMSYEAIDRRSWQAICSWQQFGGVEVVRQGIDYSHLIRCFLWDKVSRAIRKQLDPNGFQFEVQQLVPPLSGSAPVIAPAMPLSEQLKRPLLSLLCLRDAVSLKLRSRPAKLFVPYRNLRLQQTIAALSRSPVAASQITVVVPYLRQPDYEAGLPVRLPRTSATAPEMEFAGALHQAVLRGLQQFDVELLPQDADRLRIQILDQVRSIRQVTAELAFLRPQALLVFSDNHFPIQSYVHVAQREGIPTILLQHGLDCEHDCLDEAYASTIAVWGTARQQRYQQQSERQPDRIEVTGNPEYDHLRFPEQLDQTGRYWLWVTRPHRPEKCFSPSRSPQEGLDILAALLSVLKRSTDIQLVIKPHPYDYIDLYQDAIDRSGLTDQVSITNASVQSCLPDARLVISEDSTAGLEAMFWGKVVIHAHFAASKPTVPFAAYQAALPAYSTAMLQAALEQAQQLTPVQQNQILQGQRSFLQDYAGMCDGQAHQRILSLISEVCT